MILLLIQVLPVFIHCLSSFSEKYFYEISILDLNDYFIGRLQSIMTEKTYSNCAMYCVSTADCQSFLYNEQYALCRLVSSSTGHVRHEKFTKEWKYLGIQNRNCAFGKNTNMSSTIFGGVGSRGVDGNRNHSFTMGSCFLTENETNPFWILDLGQDYTIYEIVIVNRGSEDTNTSSLYSRRLRDLDVTTKSDVGSYEHCSNFPGPGTNGQIIHIQCDHVPTVARFVKLQLMRFEKFSLCEVEVYGNC